MEKTALISGGTDGIGRGAVLQLLSDGFKVVTFSRSKKHCDELKNELGKKFDKKQFLVLEGSVTDGSFLKKAVGTTAAAFKTIDVLINNAGFGYFEEADSVDMKQFKEMIDANVVGLAELTKYVVPHMKKQKSGLIINLASISAKTSGPTREFYSATKFGVMGYSIGLREELRPFGIKVATICPAISTTLRPMRGG